MSLFSTPSVRMLYSIKQSVMQLMECTYLLFQRDLLFKSGVTVCSFQGTTVPSLKSGPNSICEITTKHPIHSLYFSHKMFNPWKSDTDMIKLKCVSAGGYKILKWEQSCCSPSETCLLVQPFLAFGHVQVFAPFSLQ